MNNSNYLVLNERDNVGVLTKPLKGIPAGHKIAVRDIKADSPVIKFGQPIGISKRAISAGEHVHVHNIKFSNAISFDPKNFKKSKALPGKTLPSYFMGYPRRDGRAGTRNYIAVISTVNCSASVVKKVAGYFDGKKLPKGIDGVVPVTHGSGCAQDLEGRSNRMLNRTLAGWLDHPNVVGAVVIGLGCEDVTIESLYASLPKKSRVDKKFIDSFNIQDAGGTQRSVRTGIDKVKKLISKLPNYKRTRLPVSLLVVGLNCGGSDSFSAFTANPALGIAGDLLSARGGAIVLGETPECFGAEKYLAGRCINAQDKIKLHKIFKWWAEYGKKHGVSMNSNLSPGNILGGISTILEKSLGAIAKAGSSPISQVLEYAERISSRGLIFMDTPGFDPVSVTGMAAGGCNLIVLTTGRGSMFGCSIAPTVKIAATTPLFNKLRGDMDIDAGKALSKNDLARSGAGIYTFLVEAAGGLKTAGEKQGLGTEEFVPWQLGENF